MLKSIINIMRKIEDEFFTIHDAEGKEIVLYNKEGDIQIASCYKIKEVTLINNTINSYFDVPIELELGGKNVTAFLTDEGIIKMKSKQSIESRRRTITLPNREFKIILEGNRTYIKRIKNKVKINLENQEEIPENMYEHDIKQMESTDIIKIVDSITKWKEKDDKFFFASKDKNELTREKINKIEFKISEHKNLTLITIGIITIVTIIAGGFLINRAKKARRQNTRNLRVVLSEMNKLNEQ